VRRTLLTVLSVGIIVAWLLLSYAPATWMPQISWPAALLPWMGGLLAVTLVVFLAIQLWIVVATDRALGAHKEAMRTFGLGRMRELVLTALPIVFTVVLTAAIWQRAQMLF